MGDEQPPLLKHHLHRASLLFLIACAANPSGTDTIDTDLTTDTGTNTVDIIKDGDSLLCIPTGAGPFPGVLYNHGGRGQAIGGDLEGTCVALAEAGYLGYSKLRRQTSDLAGHIDDVLDGLNALLAHNRLDPDKVSIMGFSRGGLLTLQAATLEPSTLDDAIILMAPADGNGALDNVLANAEQVTDRMLILVAENDLAQDDHVALAYKAQEALEAAGVEVELLLYPPYGTDGHDLFQSVGDYWSDVLNFLNSPA
jgi:acetyl esterase/lipase